MKKRIFFCILILIMLAVCACGKSSAGSETKPSAESTSAVETTTASSETESTSELTTTETTTEESTTPETSEETTEPKTEKETEPEPETEEYVTEEAQDEDSDGDSEDSEEYRSSSQDTSGYSIDVNLTYGCVTVYYDGEPIRAMRASVGTSGGCETVVGDFSIGGGAEWMYMEGDVWAQYATRFYGAYLFHSVPYYSQDHGDLEYNDYNLLGSPASLGCVRLSVEDARWIYYNMPYGTPVHTFYDSSGPGPLGKPGGYWIPTDIVELRGWDPTDPVDGNPWPHYYVDITAPDISIAVGDPSDNIYDEVTVIDRYGNDVSGYAEFSDSVDTSEEGVYTAYVSVSIGGYYYDEVSFTVTVESGSAHEEPADAETLNTSAAEDEEEDEDTSADEESTDE